MSEQSTKAGLSGSGGRWLAIAVVLLVCLLIALGLWAWRVSKSSNAAWARGPVHVLAETVLSQQAPASLRALGELRAVQQVNLAAEVSGRVASIHFSAGQRVAAGDLLVQLDDSIEQADLTAAKASRAFAQQQLSRAKELAPTGAMTKESLQQRQAEFDQSTARVRQLEARILQKRIVAPFAGDLGLRRVDLGQYLNAGEEVVSLTDLGQLFVNFDIPQQALKRVQIGQQIQVDVGTPGLNAAAASISAIEPQVGRDTRNATVQAVIQNTERTLQPGMYATVNVALPAERDALLLPASAVMTSPSGDSVLVVKDLSEEQLGRAEFVPVTISRRIDNRVVIGRGLTEGDVVVTEGQLRVQPGSQLKVTSGNAETVAQQGNHL